MENEKDTKRGERKWKGDGTGGGGGGGGGWKAVECEIRCRNDTDSYI